MKTLFFVLVFAGAALADEPQPHVYRLDFTVTQTDAGKAATTSSYTLGLEEKHMGEVRMGTNVVLQPSNTRIDIGFSLRTSFVLVGEDLLLEGDAEISAAQDPSAIHKVSAKSEALVAPGKPALVASLEDPFSHQRYQVSVTATKLR